MLELTGLSDVIRVLSGVYVLLAVGAAALVLWRVKHWVGRVVWLAVVLVVFGWLPVKFGLSQLERQREAEAFAERRAEAVARMEVLCEAAGEFIHRTAEGVDGVFLMRLRPTDFSERNQWAVDPYGRGGDDSWTGFRGQAQHRVPEWYVKGFLRARDEHGAFVEYGAGLRFEYVDLIDPEDGVRYRYTGYAYVPEHLKNNPNYTGSHMRFELKREPVTAEMVLPRYGVTFEDITEHADRERWWIAGSALRVVDLETGEVMGERIGYVVDPYIGEGGSYTNWTTIMFWGKKCPPGKPRPARAFVEDVVKPNEVVE